MKRIVLNSHLLLCLNEVVERIRRSDGWWNRGTGAD